MTTVAPKISKALAKQQYFTPQELSQHLSLILYKKYDELVMNRYGRSWHEAISLLDPQSGNGTLIQSMGAAIRSVTTPHSRGNTKVTCEIDKSLTFEEKNPHAHTVADCIKLRNIAYELAGENKITFDIGVANPPRGLTWKINLPLDLLDINYDSTLWTYSLLWQWCNAGLLIGESDKIDEIVLGIDQGGIQVEWSHVEHDLEKHFDTVSFPLSCVMWIKERKDRRLPNYKTGHNFWTMVSTVVGEETKKNKPDYNIYTNKRGYIKLYLPFLIKKKLNLTPAMFRKFMLLEGQHPYTLAADNEQRKLLQELLATGELTISPEAEAVIRKAIDESVQLSCPIMPITDFEHIAYTDDMEKLVCHTTNHGFIKGDSYKKSNQNYRWRQEFTRVKQHYNEETGDCYNMTHRCELTGTDKKIVVVNSNRESCTFLPNIKEARNDQQVFHEHQLWEIFEKPVVHTVKEMKPELIKSILKEMDAIEMLADFKYFPGQRDFYSRVAAKLCALVAAETGTGKTLGAITLALLSRADRCLIVAPQGVTKDEETDSPGGLTASQWLLEIERFAPFVDVYRLFSYQDYLDIKSRNGGELPHGIYISYYEAMFYNSTVGKGRAMERLPKAWNDQKLCNFFGLPPSGDWENMDCKHIVELCETVGEERNGIKCIASPSMSCLIGDQFDFIGFDEAHKMAKLSSIVTDTAIRMRARYRYAFTATPIPNTVSDIFSLMGWLCVDHWHEGGLCNAAFPFRREDRARFDDLFLCRERDYTAEQMKRKANDKYRGVCIKQSPVIASPSRLLKIIKSTVAYISKSQCNPDYVKPTISDIRVPMGLRQAALYDWYTNRGNIPHGNPMVAAGMQINYLRGICADPMGVSYNNVPDRIVPSNFNPKVISTLELVGQLITEGHQVVIINSRTGIASEIRRRLEEAGIECARIDSTVPAKQHSTTANNFKAKKIPVLLMGIKCAVGHSFDQCKHLIIASLEYSYGTFHQAIGRVDRLTSNGSQIYCLLNKDTIEDHIFDVVATKGDAATICLKGERVPREFKPVDMGEVLANSMLRARTEKTPDEFELEKQWPRLKEELETAAIVWTQ